MKRLEKHTETNAFKLDRFKLCTLQIDKSCCVYSSLEILKPVMHILGYFFYRTHDRQDE